MLELAVPTPGGAAVALVDEGRSGLLVLGHGAGGGVEAPDLLAARDAALAVGWAVARVLQPYRVAGRRAPSPAARLDEALLSVVAALRAEGLPEPLVLGGRSSGARVACRTAAAAGAVGVLGLAFPLQPPAGRPDRGPELRAAGVPRLVVQGDRDAFGDAAAVSAADPDATVVAIAGADHALRRPARDGGTAAVLAEVRAAVGEWLAGLRR